MRTTERIVAVTGATGRQGGAAARHLLRDGWRVRALTRDPGGRAARALARSGAEVVGADLADPDRLAEALRGAHGVFSVQTGPDETALGTAVADAALAAGVRHLVYASAGPGTPGTGVPPWDGKLAVEEHLARLDVPRTVLRPMALMELMTDRDLFPALAVWSTMPRLMGEHRSVPWICADDVGAVAARAFGDRDSFLGRVLPLAADVRTVAECRSLWRAEFGARPRRAPVPTWLFERFAGTGLTAMWRWLRDAPFTADPGPTLALLPSARSVRVWLAERAARR